MEEQMYKNILVGVDGSDQANLAYERALRLLVETEAESLLQIF